MFVRQTNNKNNQEDNFNMRSNQTSREEEKETVLPKFHFFTKGNLRFEVLLQSNHVFFFINQNIDSNE